MKKLFSAWLQSARYALSYPFYSRLFFALKTVSWCLLASILGFAGVAAISYMNIPYISAFFHGVMLLMPPCVAVLASPIYGPFLIRSMSRIEKDLVFAWGPSLWWLATMYATLLALGGGLYWMSMEGDINFIFGVGILIGVVLPFVIYKGLYFPIATVAMLFKPMSDASSPQLWAHSKRMTRGEWPSIVWLYLMLLPFSCGGFYILNACVNSATCTPYTASVIFHGINMVCWEISWVAFMVFYQQRKHLYL